MPTANLIDANASVLGAGNGDAEVIAITPNGRYAIFASAANDIIPQQNDTPGTRDLFWADFLTGARKLVTGAPTASGGAYLYVGTTTAFGRAFAGVEPFSEAVLSDDGQFVGFTSKVNAGSLDDFFATGQQLAGKTRTAPADRGDTTYDVFRWKASSGDIRLASRTIDLKTAPAQAFGFRVDSGTPAISGDGSTVGFVSVRTASVVYPPVPVGKSGDFDIKDSPDNSPDVFLTDFIQVDAGQGQTTTVVSKVPNPTPDPYRQQLDPDDNQPILDWHEDFGTFGFVSALRPIQLESWFKWNFLFDFVVYDKGRPEVGKSTIGVQVDPLGRYLSSDGKTVTFLSDIHPLYARTTNPGSESFMPAAAAPAMDNRLDVYLATIENVQVNTAVDVRDVTLLDDNRTNPPLNLTPSMASLGGSADNAIIARDNDTRVMFTAGVTLKGTLIPNYNGPTGFRGADMNLYIREHRLGSVLGDEPILVNAIDGNPTTPGNLKSPSTTVPLAALQLLIDPAAPTPFPPVDPRSYNITGDGRFAVFVSPSSNMLPVAKGNPTDKNSTASGTNLGGAYDIFRRDLIAPTDKVGAMVVASADVKNLQTGNGPSINPAISPDGRFVGFQSLASNLVSTGVDINKVSDVYVRDFQASKDTKGNFVPRTGLASSNPDGSLAGDAASFMVLPLDSNPTPTTRPSLGTGRIVFTSQAGNLTPDLAVVTGTQHAYRVDLPITTAGGGTGSTDVGAVGGGFQATAALIRFSGNGNIEIQDKFTPFPGFIGEIPVAAGDVNGDGLQDLIAGGGSGGGPRVTVIDGATGSRTLTRTDPTTGAKITYTIDFFAYESTFRGGVTVAAGDVNQDGFADIIIGTGDGGGSRVRVISGIDGKTVLSDFFAYESQFRGGVRVAVGDVTGDGTPDVITGAGMGGGPRVSVFSFVDPAFPGTFFPLPPRVVDFFAFEPTLRNGVYVGAGDITGDGNDEVVVGGGPGGGPRVTAFDGKALIGNDVFSQVAVVNFFAFPDEARTGVRVAVRDIDGNGTGDIVTGMGSGEQSRVRTFLVDDPDSRREPVLIDDEILFGDFGSLNGAWVG